MKSFLVIIGLALAFVALSFLAMSFRVLFIKNGTFPKSSVGGNKHLAKQGIRCARGEEIARFRKMQKKQINKINPDNLKVFVSK